MQLHQILTGSCNIKDQCISYGSLYSVTFIAYGSGSDLVILNNDFIRHQIIQGDSDKNSQINAVSCSKYSGKILVLYSDFVYIFEPVHSLEKDLYFGLSNYNWVFSSQLIKNNAEFKDLCWVPKVIDTVLLVGNTIQIWTNKELLPSFSIGTATELKPSWNRICNRNSPENKVIERIKFSPDGKFFATFSTNSKELFIWFWDQKSALLPNDEINYTTSMELFDFISIKHPTYILSFEWRNISHFLPRNSINNALLTCCDDKVCRIWSESHLHRHSKSGQYKNTDDSTVQFDGVNNEMKFSDHLKNIFFTFIQKSELNLENSSIDYLSSDLNNISCYDVNKNYLYPKFVLSAAINNTSDIPLFSSLSGGNSINAHYPLTIHWLDNKELDLTSHIECNLRILTSDVICVKEPDGSVSKDLNLTDKLSQFKRNVIFALEKWKKSSDVVFAIHPQNGSLLVWLIHNLDDSGGQTIDNKVLNVNRSIYIKNAQISVDSCLPNCVPVADATTMCTNIFLYCDQIHNKSFFQDLCSNEESSLINMPNVNYDIKMISKQHNGSLNMWSLTVSSDDIGHSSILNMRHLSRISGHRWQTNCAACHIQLPLLLTISNLDEKKKDDVSEISELILWRIKQVGPFSKSGGITEIARINSKKYFNFSNIAWFPGTVPSQLLGLGIASPSSFFIASDSNDILYTYLSITNAKDFLKNEIYKKTHATENTSLFQLISLASTGEPGCILSAGTLYTDLDSDNEKRKTIFLHVYTNNTIVGYFDLLEGHIDRETAAFEFETRYHEIYYTVRILSKERNGFEETYLEMWRVEITESNKEQKKKSLDDLIKLNINNEKVYCKLLDLPSGVTIIKAVPASGHLSSASIYPECLAPYLITVICSDNNVRFFKCVTNMINSEFNYQWKEWTMELTDQCSSSIVLKEKYTPLNISCAYSGRVAVAYYNDPPNFMKNITVDVYECESSGGSEWILEDSIKLTDKHATSVSKQYFHTIPEEKIDKQPMRLSCTKNDFILIDWVNSEDGSHLLSISIGSQLFIFTTSCSEISKFQRFELENMSSSKFARWMKVKEISLNNSDSNSTLPDHISWAREGLLIVGLNNELHVYNQWNDKMNGFNNFTDFSKKKEGYELIDNDRDLTKIMKLAPNANFSIARLKDAYYSSNDFKRSQSRTYLENIEIEFEPNFSSDEVLENSALFEASQLHNPVLPQYHPKQLMEWINFGKISRVMAILSHLTNCTSDIIVDTTHITQKTDENTEHLKDSEDLSEKNQLEIKAIPPLPLHILLEIDMEIDKKLEKKVGDDIFSTDYEDNTIMEFDILNQDNQLEIVTEKCEKKNENKPQPWTIFQSLSELVYFGPEQSRKLAECLTRIQLPGLSTLDQVYLLGIAELMSNIKSDYPVSPSYKKTKQTQQDSTNSLDDCGLRFLLAMQHFSYMIRTLPLNQKTNLMDQGVDTSSLIWGFHSESEDELCTRLDDMTPDLMTWDDFKRYGCGWWIRNDITLQRVVEKITKNIFQKTKDPMDAAIFYLAMGKQKLLSKLFRNCNKNGLETFFMLDFSLPENRSRALSQAFKMRSKRRYDHAVALFLLCKSIDDALLICLHNLNDIQMALTISRLYDMNVTRNSKNLESIITNHVIGSNDPFLRSMGFWMIKEYAKSLETLLQCSPNKVIESSYNNTYTSSDPVVFVFYNFLKKHPIILRQNVIINKALGDQDSAFKKDDNITPMERRLFFRTAYTYLRMGSPNLALEVLAKLPEQISITNDICLDKSERIMKTVEIKNEVLDTGLINWDDFTNFSTMKAPDFQIDFNCNEHTDNIDEICDDNSEVQTSKSGQLDIMCLQYKFMICLKLISEELCTLATGIETNGSYLRYNFYTWLEKEVQVLHYMCRHAPNESLNYLKFDDFGLFSSNEALLTSGNLKNDSRKNELEIRKLWLKNNHSLLLSLYSFCSLRGPSIVGLASIRMEMLILIQELQGSSCFENDICKALPTSINLPFINSALSPENGLIITPVQHLKTLVTDIMDCINSFECPFSFLFHHSAHCSKPLDNELNINRNKIKLLRSQCQAMSACLHQCLSNFENHNVVNQSNINGMDQRIRHSSTSVIYSPESDIHLRSKKLSEIANENVNPNTDPRNWPGFSNLIHLISSSVKKDIFNFSYLLGESLVAVYIGILIYALHLNDANLLYRLTNVEFNKAFWGKMFGGTLRKKPSRPTDPPQSISSKESPKILRTETKSASPTFSTSPCVTRNKLYANLVPPIKQQSATIDEKFIPPIHSILTALLEKPTINSDMTDFIYNSDDEETGDIDENDSSSESEFTSSRDTECQNSKSYTWSILRLVILHASKSQVLNLVKLLQIENRELAIFCPNIFTVIKCLNQWERQSRISIFNFPDVPRSYSSLLNDCDIKDSGEKSSRSEVISNRINKICKQLTKKDKVPFSCHYPLSLSMKRLWINLMGNSKLQPLFIQQLLYLNDKNNEKTSSQKVDSSAKLTSINYSLQADNGVKAIKIIHKEHECIYSLAVNQINKSIVVACTSKEIIELNLNNLTNPEKWMKDDFDYLLDIIKDPAIKELKSTARTSEYAFSNDFLLVTPTFGSHVNYISQNYNELSYVTLKRPISGMHILKSHPSLPYYLAGNNSGQVSVFEWANETPIVKTYSPIQKGKITALNFDESGNKFGMGDSEGNFSLCHFSYADNSRAQYFSTRCPHKGVTDFCFLNSSSLVATCGGSNLTGLSSVNHLHAVSGGISTFDSNSINISIWDTLLPTGRNQVRSFSDPQLAVGVVSLCYSSRYDVLIIGTKKGEIAIIDLKQSAIRNIYQAHEQSITSIKLDPLQFYFVSSSVDGSIKIWNLYTQELLECYRNDPVKSSVFSKNDVGIRGLSIIDDDKLLSCGADGFIRLRYLDPKALNNNMNFDAISF